jgi:hypothetical protein
MFHVKQVNVQTLRNRLFQNNLLARHPNLAARPPPLWTRISYATVWLREQKSRGFCKNPHKFRSISPFFGCFEHARHNRG